MMKKIFLIIFLISLFFPLISEAIANTYIANSQTVCYEGLVPCGKIVYTGGVVEKGKCIGGTAKEIPCQFCHIFVMVDAILDFVIGIAFIVAVGMIVLAGLLFILAYSGIGGYLSKEKGGGPKLFSQAKSILGSVLLGLVIIFAAWAIVETIFTFLGVAKWTRDFTGPGKWSQIKCPIELSE